MPTEQSERVRQLLGRRSDHPDASRWLGAISASLAGAGRLEDDTLEALQQFLRGHYGGEYTKIGDDHDAHVEFWRSLSHQFADQPRLKAIYADTLLISGRDRDLCLRTFLEAVNADPGLYPEHAGDFQYVAEELGGESLFEFRLAELRFAVHEDDGDDDFTKALTRELHDEFGANPARAAQIEAVVQRT